MKGITKTKNARLELRVDKETKTKAERASALLGLKSLTEYVASVLEKDATRVIEEHNTIEVTEDMYDQFIQACENAEKPNKDLQDALAFTKKKGFIENEFKI